MPEKKDAAEGAQKIVQLQFSKSNSLKVVTSQILEQFANRSEEFKTALKEVLENQNPLPTVLEIEKVKKWAVNKRRLQEGSDPYVLANAIEAAWNGYTEAWKEKSLQAHSSEQEKRKSDVSEVFKEIIERRLGSDILDEVKRGEEYETAILKGDLIWLIKRIRKVKSLGVSFESGDTLENLQKIKQDSKSCSAHLLAFSNGISEMIRAGGWTKAELDTVGSLQATLVKKILLDSLSLRDGQSIMAGAIVAIRNDASLTYEQMTTKLVEAEASQKSVDEKTSEGASRKRAHATKKEETNEGDDKGEKSQPWKPRGDRGRGGRGSDRSDNSGRGGRGDNHNNGRSDKSGRGGRGGHGRGGGGRGAGGRGRGNRGDEHRGGSRDNDRDRNDGRGDEYSSRGRGGRGGGRSSYNSGGRGNRRDRDDNDGGSSSWRDGGGSSWRDGGSSSRHEGGDQRYKRTRFEQPAEKLMVVCVNCEQKPHKCRCNCDDDDEPSGQGRGKGARKVGISKSQYVGYDDGDEYDYSEEPYRYARKTALRARTSSANDLVQFDTAADILVLKQGSKYLDVESDGPPLAITGITGQTVTPKKSGKIGMLEAVQDPRFSAAVAPGMALVKANPGCGVLMSSNGLQVIDYIGMDKIKTVVNVDHVMATGVAKPDGWYLEQKDVRTLAQGTPSKVMQARAAWASSEDRVVPSPTTESHQVRVIRRRRVDNLQPERHPALQMTPAAMKLATEAQQVRSALHPSDAQLQLLLENKLIDTQASARDGLNALQQFGPDYARLKAVVHNPPQYSKSQNHPALEVGEVVSGDLHVLPKAKTKTNYLSLVDHYSAFQHIEPLGPSKSTKAIEEGIATVVKDYNQNTHRVGELRFDSEANLTALSAPQAQGIKVTHAPPGAHETFAESHYGRVQQKNLTILNTLRFKFDNDKHPNLAMGLIKTAGEFNNVLPNSRTGHMTTPYQLFTGERHKLKPENMVPIGTIALFKDRNASGLDPNKTRAGIIVGYNWTCPGSFWVYDPTTGRKPELEFLGSTKHILDHDAAMRLVDQWDGFKAQATLNLPLQPVPTALVSGDPVQMFSVPEGAQPIVQEPDQVVVNNQEGAQEQVQEPVEVHVQVQEAVDGPAPQDAVQVAGDAINHQVAPQTPVGERVAPPEPPPPTREGKSQPAPQQEGESDTPAKIDLKAAFFTLTGKNGAVCAAEIHHVMDMMELWSTKVNPNRVVVNASKKTTGANSGSQLYKKYERQNPEALEAALRIEIEGLSKRMLGHAVPSHTLSVKEMQNVVHTMVLLKEKFLPSGEFDKLKARLVALGNHMKEGTYGDTYSPTLGHASLMVLLCIGAADDAVMKVTDVPCAFPNTPRDPKDGRVTIRITGKAAEIWCDINPDDWVLLNRQGHLLVDLDQYLYGMKDAPAAFHRYLKTVLEEAGFEAIISDVCLIKKFSKKGYFIAGGHVDDLLSLLKGDPQLEVDFVNALAVAFGGGYPLESKEIENSGNYLGMFIERDRKNRTIYLSQPQSIDTIYANYPDINWNQRAPTPSTKDLYNYDKNAGPEINGERVDVSKYLSKVMAGMWVCGKTRPDGLMDLTFLSGIKEPTERAMAMVDRVLVYLYNTRHKRLRLQPVNFKLAAFGDAGFATHIDGYSQSGMVFTFGETPFFFKCGKQRRITLSSTDGEYETLTEICKYIEWLRGLLEELDIYQDDPIEVYQDNKSTITLATGPGTFKRSKQNLIRYQYVKDLVKDGTIDIVWVPTENMLADILTKVLVGAHFRSQVEGLGVV